MILHKAFEADPNLFKRNLVGSATPSDGIPDTMTNLSGGIEFRYHSNICGVVERQHAGNMAVRHAKHNVSPLDELDG